jgi:putrescine transport system substrate-binding protein
MFYDPTVLARFRDCGVSVLDSPVNLLSTVLIFLGKDPNSESPEDLKAVEQVLLSIRPYVRYVDTARYINDLANGETCLALGWSGDIDQARERAKEAGNGVEIAYSIPSEGTLNIFGALAIPADAPHPRNAHLFINYLLRPDVAANNSNAIKYANPVTASVDLLSPDLRNDPAVYPPLAVRAKLIPEPAKSQEFTRLLMRTWTRFKTGR